jgi:hypothetical protein
MEQIIVTVDEQGNVKVEAKGVQGVGCRKLTEAIRNALGETTHSTKKPELYAAAGQAATSKAVQTAGAGK